MSKVIFIAAKIKQYFELSTIFYKKNAIYKKKIFFLLFRVGFVIIMRIIFDLII